jgi:Ion channel
MSSSDSAQQSKPPSRRLTVIIVLWGVGIWTNLFFAETPGNWVMTVLWIIIQLLWCASLITSTFQQLSGKPEWLPPGQVLARVLGSMSLLEGIFAQIYDLLSANRPQAFSSPLTGIDAAYFTISTATTTGMGDIHPVSGAARLLVTAQMVSSLALVVAALGIALNRFYGQATPPRKSEGAS